MTPPLYPLAPSNKFTRRSFLAGSASFAIAALLAPRVRGVLTSAPRFKSYPFTLGIASGDPSPDGVVLWTRLAPQPELPDGGMPQEPIEVSWQVSEDEAMTRIVQSGKEVATPRWGHSVHAEVTGLKPERWYWYRFKVGTDVSPIGRTRTMPAAGTMPDRLRFTSVSCQKYETGYYTAYEYMLREDLDLVVHLGDYIYEKLSAKDAPRAHGLPLAQDLDSYRMRYAHYKMDPTLQAVHAMAPWIVTWDDHEVGNDYAGIYAEHPEDWPLEKFLLRRAAGYQAYYEHMPLRRSALPSGPDMGLYRRLEFGRLASFNVLDTRQYRSDQVGDDQQPPSPAVSDPSRTILGDQQRQWLYDGLDRSTAKWNVLAQQVMMARLDFKLGPGEEILMDKWSGYEADRSSLVRRLRDHRITNPVVLTGDLHTNWANEVSGDPDHADGPPVTTEFVCTSISSSGDGQPRDERFAQLRGENPCVKFYNAERGYVHCEVTPETWQSSFKTVEYISRPHAPLNTRATFVVESGRPRLNRV